MVPQQVKEDTVAALADLPPEARVGVASSFNKMTVSVHLLDAYPADDKDPYVKGQYFTKDRLRNLIEDRSADIYRRIFTRAHVPDNVTVCVRCRHGVRVTYVGAFSGTSDQATTLYETEISGKKAAGSDWQSLDVERIRALWRVTYDLIPDIQLQAVAF
jgi:hypothetical protein